MKMKKIIVAIVGLVVISGGMFVGASPASAKECAYLNGAQCTGWYANADTCKGIAYYGSPAHIRACEAWAGFGSHG
ncbi:exported hypothetical protein [Curtobacterium sp. 8I-2]|nr:exported hypothetical protein [Curtobacterium sp. 8I-2]